MRKLSRSVGMWLLVVGFLSGVAHASSAIVISQVYGGGGNAGATLRADFIELFNRSNAAVSVNGWSIQYAASAIRDPCLVDPGFCQSENGGQS